MRLRRRERDPLRRRRRRPRRGLYLLPQLCTSANLFFGFFAIVEAQAGRYGRAAFGIILALVFDIFDGRLARLSRSTSDFGREYDSLADLVSFGVAPAIFAFEAGNLEVLGRAGWVMAFLYTVCAALRLARFNISHSPYAGRFEGLPSPAAAAAVVTSHWFVHALREGGWSPDVPESAVAVGLLALGLLMVSGIPYRSLKEVDLRHSYRTLVVMVLVFAWVALEPFLSLFVATQLYVLSGLVEWLWRRASRRQLLRVDATPEGEETRLAGAELNRERTS